MRPSPLDGQPSDDGLRAMLDGAPFPFVVSALDDGTVLYLNAAMARLFGNDAATAVGGRAADFWADPAHRARIVARLRAGEAVAGEEARFRRADGTLLWAQFSAAVLRYGGRGAVCASFADITAQKDLEERLRERGEQYRRLVESSHDVIFTADASLALTFASPAFEAQLGWSPDEVLGRPLADLLHPDDASRCLPPLLRVAETGEPRLGLEHRLRHRDGSWRWHQTNAAAWRDGRGRLVGLVGSARDTDAQRALQARAARAERLASLGAMAAGMAHEINNPLTFALSNLHFAQEQLRGLPDPLRAEWPAGGLAELEQALAEAGEGAARVKAIVADLRAFAFGLRGGDARCDLRSGLDQAIRVARNAFGASSELELELPELPSVSGCQAELSQMFACLLVNAGQAAGPKGRIRVQAARRGDLVEVRVLDSGPGIAPDLLPRVFDPFVTTRPPGAGLGLGLSVALGIARGLGGDVTIAPSAGPGTEVVVTLPVAGDPTALAGPGA